MLNAFCAKHPKTRVTFFVKECLINICLNCVPEYNNKEIVLIKTFLGEHQRQWKGLLNGLNQKDKLIEVKREEIEQYSKLKENIAKARSKCEKMIRAASLLDAKTLHKAEQEGDLERYSARTIGFYKQVVKELNNRKEREKRRAKKAEKAQNGESGVDGEKKVQA